MTDCISIIGYLRRIGGFSEYEIRLQFLRCREAWLTGILDDLDQRNPHEYLKSMVPCHRAHLFDVVNQYRAIFADDTSGSEENYDGGLLFSWAMHQITAYLRTLKHMLPKINEGVSLSNILDTCMYCAMGFGSVGLDIRGLLPPLFEEAVVKLFIKNVCSAVENFQLVLDTYHWIRQPTYSNPSGDRDNHDDVKPPDSLMDHPPLAVFINGVSAALNELRPCAPISLKHILAQELVKGLKSVHDSLLRYNEARLLRENESVLFFSLCRAFVEVAFPYCATCFGYCYSGGAVLIMDAKSSFDGIRRLLSVSVRQDVPKPAVETREASTSENGSSSILENGTTTHVETEEKNDMDKKDEAGNGLTSEGSNGDSQQL